MGGGIDPAAVMQTILTTYVFGTFGISVAIAAFVLSVCHSLKHHNFNATIITTIAILLWFGARTIFSTAGIGAG